MNCIVGNSNNIGILRELQNWSFSFFSTNVNFWTVAIFEYRSSIINLFTNFLAFENSEMGWFFLCQFSKYLRTLAKSSLKWSDVKNHVIIICSSKILRKLYENVPTRENIRNRPILCFLFSEKLIFLRLNKNGI